MKNIYPDYKLSKLQITKMIKELKKYFGLKATNCIILIKNYEKTNKIIKETPKQQWHIHNPNLNFRYFDNINSVEKAYWLGFISADATIRDKNNNLYELVIELSIKDKQVLERFKEVLKTSADIHERTRKMQESGKFVQMVSISIGCKHMIKSLKKNGIFGSKSQRKTIPKCFYDNNGKVNLRLFLAWLRGYYDGDGRKDTTIIVASNKQLLTRIKNTLKLPYKIGIQARHHNSIDQKGRLHICKTVYRLALGSKIFNEMSSICKSNGVILIKRKDRSFSDIHIRYNNLKQKLKKINIDKNIIQEMTFKFKKYKLAEKFNTSIHLLNKLINEWNIENPPRGYWSSNNLKS